MTYDSGRGADIVSKLPAIFPRDDDSDNYKLFQVVGHGLDDAEEDLEAVDRATTVQEADTIEQIEELGKLVDIQSKEGEGRESYRSRVIAKHQLVTGEATIGDVINGMAVVLNTSPTNIGYSEFDEDLTFRLLIPKAKLDQIELTESEVADIIDDLSVAGGRVEARTRGTFEYVSPATYDACEGGSDSWSNYLGYDGLDSNDDPKGGGGDYAGVLN